MPTVLELVVTLAACLGLSQLLSERGDRAWAAAIAVITWVLMEFLFLLIGVWTEWAGWFTR